jgi:hypothetical protein
MAVVISAEATISLHDIVCTRTVMMVAMEALPQPVLMPQQCFGWG